MATDMVGDISGTAFWVAHYRALESKQRAPLFDDPWAERLAGERGAQIAQQLANADYIDWVVAVRTAILDRLILAAVARGTDVVVNLAAGLDVRPFRLDLPTGLRWYDVDKPEVIDYKRSTLKGARPRCDLQWLALDLSDAVQRGTTLDGLAAEARSALVITEGLLVYLDRAAVTALAQDLHRHPTFHTWLCDLASPDGLAQAQRLWNRDLSAADAPPIFGPAESTDFFVPSGWCEAEWVSILAEAVRLDRAPRRFGFVQRLSRYLPLGLRKRVDRLSGIARLERATGT